MKSTAAVLAAKEQFIRAGLATFDEEDVTCCYAVQDKVWITDPDGNNWEVFVVLDADAPEHSANRMASGPADSCACATGGNTSRGKTLELVNRSANACC